MYLLTFAFLTIGMLGIYTQVYAVETARLLSTQSGVAQTLLTWHAAAASLAGNVVEPALVPPVTGCSLTLLVGTPCTAGDAAGTKVVYSLAAFSAPPYPATITGGTYTTAAGNSYPSYPGGFPVTTPYQWNSVAFVDPATNQYYVVTYVNPPAGGGDVTTATGVTINYTASNLYQQLQQTGAPNYSYGWAKHPAGSGATFASPAINGKSGIINLPTTIPDGALVIISSPGQCSGC